MASETARTGDRATQRLISKAMRTPMLSRAQESRLIRRWLEDEDERALHELVAAHARLAISVASKFRGGGVPFDDLVQQGHIGLLKAAARFEPERNVRFATYAGWWVRSEIYDYVLQNWSMVRIGRTSTQKSLFLALRRLRARLDGDQNATALREQIAESHGVSVADVEAMEQVAQQPYLSLNTSLGDEEASTWQDRLVDDTTSPEDSVMLARDRETRSRWLRSALRQLPAREQKIVRDRHLKEDRRTLDDLGQELGISKERVRQIEQRAVERIRRALLPLSLSELSA